MTKRTGTTKKTTARKSAVKKPTDPAPDTRVYVDEPEKAGGKIDHLPERPKRDRSNPEAERKWEKEREEIFNAEEPTWRGQPLRPLTVSRESLWLEHRGAVGAPSLGYALGDVSAFFADAVRLLFLCSHEPEEWRGLRGDPATFQEHMEAWADGLLPGMKLPAIYREEKTAATIVAMNLYNANQKAVTNRYRTKGQRNRIWETSIPGLGGAVRDRDRFKDRVDGTLYPLGTAADARLCLLSRSARAGRRTLPLAGPRKREQPVGGQDT